MYCQAGRQWGYKSGCVLEFLAFYAQCLYISVRSFSHISTIYPHVFLVAWVKPTEALRFVWGEAGLT